MLSNVKYRKTLAHMQLSKYGKLQRITELPCGK